VKAWAWALQLGCIGQHESSHPTSKTQTLVVGQLMVYLPTTPCYMTVHMQGCTLFGVSWA
jgi:hypothetical protein